MNVRTLRLTYGAMLVAVFGVLLALDRQTGGILRSVMTYVLPIPMAAYAVRYGGKASLTVFVCMVLVTIFLGTPGTFFYTIGSALIGLVLGARIYKKRDLTRTLILIMVLSMVVSLLGILVAAAITGVGIDADVREFQKIMQEAIQRVGEQSGQSAQLQAVQQMMTTDYLKRIMLVALAFTGGLQGFIVYHLTLLVLRKLRIAVPLPTPIWQYFPPRWTGFLAFVLMLLYNTTAARPLSSALLQNLAQVAGICGDYYLLVFGMVAAALFLRCYVTKSRVLVVVLTLLAVLALSQGVMLLGLWYLSGSLHDRLLDRMGIPVQERGRR